MKSRWTTCVGLLVAGLSVGLAVRHAPAGSGAKKPLIRAWSHCYVRALDVEKTFRFYHNVLGMSFTGWKSDGKKAYYYFESGGVRICVGGFPADPSDYKPRRMTTLNVHLTVPDLGAFYERIRNTGYENVTEPRTAIWGARTFTVYDPNGVALGITEWVGKSDWQQSNKLKHGDPFARQAGRP